MGNLQLGFCCQVDEDELDLPRSLENNYSWSQVSVESLASSTSGSSICRVEVPSHLERHQACYYDSVDQQQLIEKANAFLTHSGNRPLQLNREKKDLSYCRKMDRATREARKKQRRVSDIIAKPLPFHPDTGKDIVVHDDAPPAHKLKRTISLKKKLSLLAMLHTSGNEVEDVNPLRQQALFEGSKCIYESDLRLGSTRIEEESKESGRASEVSLYEFENYKLGKDIKNRFENNLPSCIEEANESFSPASWSSF
mmetsp:Transcript_10995/g.12568  ORF Transcript_10995/g.12568 Transcript_10995/m.12568 type:complete len:254 (-) Transcript_10995:1681-2442(-)|eukprot:CAMPEP_0184022122 /NCGR_PEP_ID=MMETSP0954-20121128/10397_1 /TAXON_ID=627963 /ORGANISM="Aplanochytrium sp, Strain PBS07" /LENGTH=253 /DNA_ID=CAMNT_0026304395 /DNA_START=401 /DNA_END=1162 /DNA_ORIENTATION=+